MRDTNIIIELNQDTQEIEVEVNNLSDQETSWCLVALLMLMKNERGMDKHLLKKLCTKTLNDL